MSLVFLHTPSDIVRWLLIQLGVGTTPLASPLGEWPCIDDQEPDRPDNCLTTYDTTPRHYGTSMIDGYEWKHYGFQVRVRGADKPTAGKKAYEVHHALTEGFGTLTVTPGIGDTAQYQCYRAHNVNILRLGLDSPGTKRSLFTVNGLISIRRTA
jgi:hypothetical protein